jgi:putative endonuclease
MTGNRLLDEIMSTICREAGAHQSAVCLHPALAMKTYCVYILASDSGVLYIGVTNSLTRRVWQHKQKLVPGFTSEYNVTKLVYYDVFEDVRAAIQREKQIKRWSRVKKVLLIERKNPKRLDLFAEQPTYDEIPDELA